MKPGTLLPGSGRKLDGRESAGTIDSFSPGNVMV